MRRKVAIIGVGIGAHHLEGYRQAAAKFEVKVLCDLNTRRAEAALSPGEQISVCSDLAKVLADPEIDIIDICLPPHLHRQVCLDALAAGKHVICEKPLCASLAEADELAQASLQANKTIFPVFQYRFGLGALQLKSLQAAKLTGKALVANLETHWSRGDDYYAVNWRGTWRGEQGGVIVNHAIHIHDLLCLMLGPIASVGAELATRANEIEVEDCAALAIRMTSGALVTSSITLGAATNTTRLRFCFDKLTAESGLAAYTPAEDGWTFTARAPYAQEDIDAHLAMLTPPATGYAGLFQAIAAALDGKPGNEVTLDDARRSLEFISAVYASFRSGLPVSLPLSSEHEYHNGWLPDDLR